MSGEQDDPSALGPPPLAGLVVLDLGQIYCGPYCGFLLARLGAEVIKIEPPTGELTRHRSSPGVQPVALTLLNTNKDGVRLDLKTDEGKATFRALVTRADVVLENFAAGVMDRLGVGYDELKKINPRLVYAGATGFGREGPYNKLNAMDLTVQAMTGVLDSNGYANAPPVKAGVAVADFAGGTHLTVGIIAALFQRTITGLGQRIDVSMQDALLPYLTSNISGYLTAGPDHPPRTGNQHGSLSVSPYNVYPAVDGFVAILCAADRHWRSMCRLMERDDLADSPRFALMTARAQHNDEVDVLMTAWTRTSARADIVSALMDAGIPVAPVMTVPEVLRDENLVARGMIQQIEDPVLGPILAYGSPISMSASTPVRPSPAPRLGEDTGAVLKRHLGLSDDEVSGLKARGII